MTQALVAQSEAGSLPQLKSMQPLSRSILAPSRLYDTAARLYAGQRLK